ncbi:MAG: acetolactate synthase small subunit [Gammaproteobacteria bacterium]|nr:acetolactate synthase small subunit [Gammaproteobacteria bacterium]
MRHIISLLVENEAGALSRISGLFSARGYNIDSLTVASTEDPTLSRMTIVSVGSDRIIEQITKQLNKLVDVVKLQDFTEGNYIEREMMFIKVKAQSEPQRAEVHRLSGIFRARVVDVSETTFCIELTGSGDKLDAYINALQENDVIEVVRSGSMGILRGEKALTL